MKIINNTFLVLSFYFFSSVQTIHASERQALSNLVEKCTFAFTGHTYPLLKRDLQFHLADQINKFNCDTIVLGGDVVTGSEKAHLGHTVNSKAFNEEQWAKFKLFHDRLNGEKILTPGNHDYYGLPVSEYFINKYTINDKKYGFKIAGNFLVMFLDATHVADMSDPEKVKYQLDPQQLKWAKKTILHHSNIENVIIFGHHRIWDMENMTNPRRGDPTQFRKILKPLLNKFKSVHIFAGDLGLNIPGVQDGIYTYYNQSHYFSQNGSFDGGFFVIDIMSGPSLKVDFIKLEVKGTMKITLSKKIINTITSLNFLRGFVVAFIMFLGIIGTIFLLIKNKKN